MIALIENVNTKSQTLVKLPSADLTPTNNCFINYVDSPVRHAPFSIRQTFNCTANNSFLFFLFFSKTETLAISF